MKEQTKGAIAVGIVVMCWLLILDLLILGQSIESVSDIVIWRCLVVFASAFAVQPYNELL